MSVSLFSNIFHWKHTNLCHFSISGNRPIGSYTTWSVVPYSLYFTFFILWYDPHSKPMPLWFQFHVLIFVERSSFEKSLYFCRAKIVVKWKSSQIQMDLTLEPIQYMNLNMPWNCFKHRYSYECHYNFIIVTMKK